MRISVSIRAVNYYVNTNKNNSHGLDVFRWLFSSHLSNIIHPKATVKASDIIEQWHDSSLSSMEDNETEATGTFTQSPEMCLPLKKRISSSPCGCLCTCLAVTCGSVSQHLKCRQLPQLSLTVVLQGSPLHWKHIEPINSIFLLPDCPNYLFSGVISQFCLKSFRFRCANQCSVSNLDR